MFNSKGEKIYPKETEKVNTEFKVGDAVSLLPGTKYTNGKDVAAWVYSKKLYIREFRKNNNEVIISTTKVGAAITGVVSINDIIKYEDPEAPSNFEPYYVRINTPVLNVRSGPSTSYKINTQVTEGQIYTIIGENKGWGRLKSGAGWISLEYVKRV